MTGAFDAARALRAGLGDRRRAWAFIREFAAAWAAPLGPGDGFTDDVLWAAEQRLGMKLPAALRAAYRLFGRRADLTACQDRLLPPDRLRVDHPASVIVFRVENQDCAEWGVAAGDGWNAEDPPVFVRQRGDRRWEPFLDRVSLACAEMVLSEVLLGRWQLGDMCELSANLITRVESAYEQLAVPEYPSSYDRSITVRWFSAPGKAAAHGRARTLLLAGSRVPGPGRSGIHPRGNPRPLDPGALARPGIPVTDAVRSPYAADPCDAVTGQPCINMQVGPVCHGCTAPRIWSRRHLGGPLTGLTVPEGPGGGVGTGPARSCRPR
jgi:hypothetical protein